MEVSWVCVDRDEAKSVGQHFILDERRVIVDEHTVYGHAWDLQCTDTDARPHTHTI